MKYYTKCRLLSLILVLLMIISGCSLSQKSNTSKTNNKTDSESISPSSEPDLSEDSIETETISDESDNNNSDSNDISQAESTITPAVWEVTDVNGNTIYMMGSIHLADSDASILPDYFESAYAKCEYLAVECDITNLSLNIFSDYMKMIYTDGTTIKDHVSTESYEKVVEILKSSGLYASSYERMKPILWVNTIDLAGAKESGLSEKYGVDVNLINRAKSEGKGILEVESVEFQNNLLANLSDEIQLVLFDSIAEDDIITKYADGYSVLYDHWKNGTISDEDISENEEDENLTDEEKMLLEEYNKILLDDRNAGMADKAIEYMNDGKKVMFVVGAAHFYGDNGILQLMMNAGCSVQRLTSEHSNSSDSSSTESAIPDTDSHEEETPETKLPEAA